MVWKTIARHLIAGYADPRLADPETAHLLKLNDIRWAKGLRNRR